MTSEMSEREERAFHNRDLDAREMAIAKKAAEMVVEDLTKNFYHSVGKTVITRLLVFVGSLVVVYAVGRGWISVKPD